MEISVYPILQLLFPKWKIVPETEILKFPFREHVQHIGTSVDFMLRPIRIDYYFSYTVKLSRQKTSYDNLFLLHYHKRICTFC